MQHDDIDWYLYMFFKNIYTWHQVPLESGWLPGTGYQKQAGLLATTSWTCSVMDLSAHVCQNHPTHNVGCPAMIMRVGPTPFLHSKTATYWLFLCIWSIGKWSVDLSLMPIMGSSHPWYQIPGHRDFNGWDHNLLCNLHHHTMPHCRRLHTHFGHLPSRGPTYKQSTQSFSCDITWHCTDMFYYIELRTECGHHSSKNKKKKGSKARPHKHLAMPAMHPKLPTFPWSKPWQSFSIIFLFSFIHAHASAIYNMAKTQHRLPLGHHQTTLAGTTLNGNETSVRPSLTTHLITSV